MSNSASSLHPFPHAITPPPDEHTTGSSSPKASVSDIINMLGGTSLSSISSTATPRNQSPLPPSSPLLGPRGSTSSGGGNSIFALVRKFTEADDLLDILEAFEAWKLACIDREGGSAPTTPYETYTLLHKHSATATHHLGDFWKCMEARFSDPHYVSQTSSSTNLSNAAGRRALIVGAGPAGLRAAVEMCLLRCDKIVVLEKRNTFNRVNVMRIHTKDMDELVHQLGARDFYRKICVQDRDVVAIRRMQIVFMKMALCLGAEIIPQAELAGIEPDKDTPYWTARTTTSTPHDLKCNTLVLAGGEKSKLSSDFGFSRTSFRAGVATGITCNFVPSHSPAAADAMQGGVVSYLSAPFFNSLKEKGLDLENLASYITEESHYLVMTPKRSTLLNKGIVKEDRADPVELVQRDNVDRDNLLKFAREVATMAGVPPDSEFLQTTSSKGGPPRPDVAIFDFTGKTCATEPSKAITSTFTPPGSNTRHPKTLLVALVGDALVEPFWPMGTGWARAVGSCKALGDCLRELGPDPLKWGERVEAVLKAHAEQYIVLKSESYAPMTNVMGSS